MLNTKEKLSLWFLVVAIAPILTHCGKKDSGGELVGTQERGGWYMSNPFGTVLVPSGTFYMGQSDQDVPATQINHNKQVTIAGFYMDDTEITNDEYRQFIQVMLNDSLDALGEDYIKTQLYPDTTVWARDFAYHLGDPMMEHYFWHPAFDDYPVTGVDWHACKYFCKWRTNHMNQWRAENELWPMPQFRLPTEAEWEYAARGSRKSSPYPWGGPYIRNAKGCLLANFKPGRGNYYDDGFQYTSPVASYFPNDFGLYDMSGNVAEWTSDAYYDAAMPVVWDMNPTFAKDDEPRKIIRGGSYKDIGYYLSVGTRSYEYEDTTKSYLGFRTVITYLGRSSGTSF